MENNDFDRIYRKIHRQSFEKLEIQRQSIKKTSFIPVIIGIIITVIMLFFKILNIMPIIIGLLIGVLISLTNRKEYKGVFKNDVINSFITEYDSNLRYTPNLGVPEYLYKRRSF